MKKIWLSLVVAVFALVLFAPVAVAQDDDYGDDDYDDGGSAVSSATSSATAAATDDDDDDDGSASATASATAAASDNDDDDALPETGGPALLAPIAGALLIAGGAGSILAVRRGRDES